VDLGMELDARLDLAKPHLQDIKGRRARTGIDTHGMTLCRWTIPLRGRSDDDRPRTMRRLRESCDRSAGTDAQERRQKARRRGTECGWRRGSSRPERLREKLSA